MKKIQKIGQNIYVKIYGFLAILIVLLNVIAWNSALFCDTYIKYVFPIWVNTYGRLTGLVPFSVGEIMLVLGVLLVAVAAVLWIFCLIKSMRKWIRLFYSFFAWTVLIVCMIMTLNCSVLYHATTFSEKYFQEEGMQEYTLEDLITVRNLVVEECERLSSMMQRDADGTILYDKDMRTQAVRYMKKLGEEYDQLNGYFPSPKPLYTSDFFSQQKMCGYYFPFSMEANYNDVMYIMNKPSTMCHELSHLRGYIFEDEANFISFLACIGAEDDLLFQYSGYLSVLNYLDNDFYRAIGRNMDVYRTQPIISAQVRDDNIFVTETEWERINAKAWFDTETVDEVSDALVDTTLKANGVADGMISYNRVVKLLLQYYKKLGVLS